MAINLIRYSTADGITGAMSAAGTLDRCGKREAVRRRYPI
jgi:hypothetical protein